MSALPPQTPWPEPHEHQEPEIPPDGIRAVVLDLIGMPLQVYGSFLALGLLHISGGSHFSRLVGLVAIVIANTGGLSFTWPLVGVTEAAFKAWMLLTRLVTILLIAAIVVGLLDLFVPTW